MASVKTVRARWVAGFEAMLPDGRVLVPGETIVEIPVGEAEQSDHWEVQGASKARKKRGKKAKPSASKPEAAAPPEPESQGDTAEREGDS